MAAGGAIWVHGETAPDGSLTKVSTEVATLARTLGEAGGRDVVGVVVAADPSAAATELAQFVPRVLAVFDVPAGRQPQPGLAVGAEQQLRAAAGVVQRDEVADQVLGRDVRRLGPEQRPPGRRPAEDVGLVGCLTRVSRPHSRYQLRDQGADIVVGHRRAVYGLPGGS